MMLNHPFGTDAVVHDPGAIERLREIDPGGSLVRKWIKGFLREAPGRMRGMRSATDGGFYPAVVAAAHSLKNVVGWLGGERLWMACQDLELAARAESESDCRQHLAVAQKELPLLEARLASYLKGNVTQRMHHDLDPAALAASIAARETIRL